MSCTIGLGERLLARLRLLGLALTAAGVVATAAVGRAQEPPEKEAVEQEAAEAEKQEDEAAAEGEEPAAEESPYLAVVGGDVHTITEGVLYGATVLVKDQRIEKVGVGLKVPEGARILDAHGMQVYPGLVAANASRLLGRPPKPIDSFDPFSLNVDLGLAGGLTTVQSGNVVGKLTRGTLDGHLLADKTWVDLNYSPTAPGGRRKLRADLERARQLLREQAEYELAKAQGGEDLEEPEDKGVNKSYAALLKGEATARFSADSAKDLLAVCDLLEAFPMRAVIFGGREAWTVAPQLGRSGARLAIVPRDRRDADPQLNRPNGWSIENARILYEAGVEFAIQPERQSISLGGIAGRDLLTLPMEAAFAIRGGLPQEAALRAITLWPARMLGVEGRIGSIEAGKDADLIICDRDLFDYRSFVQWAVVNGRIAYDKQEAPYFAHIRPRPELTPEQLLEAMRKAAADQEVGKEPAEERPEERREPDAPEGGGR